jgi:hypothetical protein
MLFSIAPLSISIFILLLKVEINGNTKIIALCSAFIYYTHMLFVHFFDLFYTKRVTIVTLIVIISTSLSFGLLYKLNRRITVIL